LVRIVPKLASALARIGISSATTAQIAKQAFAPYLQNATFNKALRELPAEVLEFHGFPPQFPTVTAVQIENLC
jgi:hypothetical protein